MKIASWISIVLSAGCWAGFGQTNSPAPRPRLSVPPPQLQSLVSAPEPPKTARATEPPARTAPIAVTLTSRQADADFRTYRMLTENGYLRRPPPRSDNRFVRYLNTTFEPAPFRVGKTKVHCSLVAAIKHKNPLCLLKPMVLNISW